MSEHANTRFYLEKALFVGRRFKAITVRPGVCRQCLRVAADKQPMRLECFRLEGEANPREKLPGGVFAYFFVRGIPA